MIPGALHLKKKGFTLIEIMTSLTIFMIVITISLGSILGIFDANRKSDSLRTVMDNLNLSVESMSREIRFGKDYHCGETGTLSSPQNCPGGDSYIGFLSSEDTRIIYRLNNSTIEKSVDGGSTFIPVTAPEITIESLSFYVLGTGALAQNTLQPRVLITIKGYAGAKSNTRTEFALQTLVSQRTLDI